MRCLHLLLVILIFYSMQTFSFRRHTTNTVRLDTDEWDIQFYLLSTTCDVFLGKCLPSPSRQLTVAYVIISKVTQNPKLINILFVAVFLSARTTGSLPAMFALAFAAIVFDLLHIFAAAALLRCIKLHYRSWFAISREATLVALLLSVSSLIVFFVAISFHWSYFNQ